MKASRPYTRHLLLGFVCMALGLCVPAHTWAISSTDILNARSCCTLYSPAALLGVIGGAGIALHPRFKKSPVPSRAIEAAVCLGATATYVIASIWNLIATHGQRLSEVRIIPAEIVLFLCIFSNLSSSLVLVEAATQKRDVLGSRVSDDTRPRPALVMLSFCGVTTWWALVIVDGWLSPAQLQPVHLAISLVASILVTAAVANAAYRWGDARLRSFAQPAACGVVLSYALLTVYSLAELDMPLWLRQAPLAICIAIYIFTEIRTSRLVTRRSTRGREESSNKVPTEFTAWLARKPLADSERTVVLAALEGHSSAEIGQMLGIKPATVRSYLQRAYRKAGVGSLRELIVLMTTQTDKNQLKPQRTISPSEHEMLSDTNAHHAFPTGRVVVSGAWLAWCSIALFSPRMGSGAVKAAITLGFAVGLLASSIPLPQPKRIEANAICHAGLALVMGLIMLEPLSLACHEALGIELPATAEGGRIAFPGAFILGTWSGKGIANAREGNWQSNPLAHATPQFIAALLFFCAHTSAQAWLAATGIAWAVSSAGIIYGKMRGPYEPCPTKEVEAVSPRMHASVPPRICAVCTIFAAYMGVALLGSHAVGSPLISLPPLCLTLYAMIRLARQDKGAAISTFACIGITWLGAIVGTTGVLSAQFAPVAGLYAGTFITVAHPHSACLWNDVESMSARLQIASAAMGLLLGRALSSLAWLSEVAARSIPNISMETFANGNLTPSSAIATTVCLIGTVACIGSIVWCLRSSIQNDPDLPPARQDACSFLRRCGLTDAEAKILAEIANGLSGKEIARKLSFAPGTVNSARHRGYRKLRINSKEELIDLLNTQKPPRSDNPCA